MLRSLQGTGSRGNRCPAASVLDLEWYRPYGVAQEGWYSERTGGDCPSWLTLAIPRPRCASPWSPAGATAAPAAGAGKKYKVSILNKEMTKDEIAAALQKEGEVNVANWTYTANDAIVGRFQAVVKEEWGVDVKCNYLPSQSPSIYLT